MFNVHDPKLRFSMVCMLIFRMIAQDEHDLKIKLIKTYNIEMNEVTVLKMLTKTSVSRKKTGYEIAMCQFKHM